MLHEGQARRLLAAPVNDVADLVADPQLQARQYLLQVPTTERRTRRYPGHPYRFVDVPERAFGEADAPGAANDAIYGQLLGLPPRRVAALQEQGVI